MIRKEVWCAEAEEKMPKRFKLMRKEDVHGLSGTGHVLNGIQWPNGKVTVCWLGEKSSIAVYDDFETFKALHMDGHGEGSNEVEWID